MSVQSKRDVWLQYLVPRLREGNMDSVEGIIYKLRAMGMTDQEIASHVTNNDILEANIRLEQWNQCEIIHNGHRFGNDSDRDRRQLVKYTQYFYQHNPVIARERKRDELLEYALGKLLRLGFMDVVLVDRSNDRIKIHVSYCSDYGDSYKGILKEHNISAEVYHVGSQACTITISPVSSVETAISKAKISYKCDNCGKKGNNLRLCGQCRVAYYCDRNCQRSDWSYHKQLCK